MTVKAKPDGYNTVTATIIAEDGGAVVDFVQQVFGATEVIMMRRPDGKVWHAEMQIGDSRVMISTATDQWKPMPANLHVYLDDTDAIYHAALAAGATSLREPTNEFYGDRSAGVRDSQGNYWWLATHVEDVSPEEMERRAAALKR
jgi:uncharacterized glyoxalase superfamily protein PhnB